MPRPVLQRRSFMAAGAATLVLPTHPASAEAGFSRWSWRAGANRFVFKQSGAVFACHLHPPGEAAPPDQSDDAMPSDAVLAHIGREETPLGWSVADLRFPDERTHIVLLRASELPLEAEITFTHDQDSGIVRRRTVLRRPGHAAGADAGLEITGTLGLWLAIHEPIERIFHLRGAWAAETQIHRARADDAQIAMESRAGKTGFAFQPYAALRARDATYLCQILWSGNWMMQLRPTAHGATILAGLNNWKFRHRILPGRRLQLPDILFARVEGGLNHATQRLHDYRRAHQQAPARPIPVQFNSWYPIFGEPTAASMQPLVHAAARLGCEAFVLDAGWYRTAESDSAEDWQTRTGDWLVSHRRFPAGLQALSQNCRDRGLRFGLWFEPEVIGPPAALRRAHPEWMHHIDGMAPRADERAILQLGIPQARRHVLDRISRVIAGLGVGWMKWDFNADLGPGGWAPALPAHLTAQDPLLAHYQGLYRLQAALRRRFPDLILEMCASGGGRMDGALLARADVNWISDQPGPLRKLAIHFGAQLAHPAALCNDWLVEWPPGATPGYNDQYGDDDQRGDLAFRLRVAMLGSFGVSATTERWTEADFAIVRAHIDLYRAHIRSIIQHGDQYLLTRAPPADGNGDWAAIWYVAKDASQGVLFAFRLQADAAVRRFPLPGLEAGQQYRLRRWSGGAMEADGQSLLAGIDVPIGEAYRSELLLVERR